MKSSAFYSVLGIGVILVAGIIWFGVHEHGQNKSASNSMVPGAGAVSSSTSALMAQGDLAIYTNGEYGFSIFYPATSKVQTSFDSTYHLPSTWRVDALSDATGTPIVEIIAYQTKSNTSFPRYFETEVRIGVSSDPKEIAACDSAGDEETALPSAAFGGATWHVFSLQDAGMMQYAQGISYRTVHDGDCVALEQVESGSSYTDDTMASSSANIPQAVLTANYEALSAIVRTFSFARS